MAEGAPPMVRVLEMGMGMWFARGLAAAAELGIADKVAAGARPVSELAKETGTDEGALYRLLRTLASRGVFREVSGKRFEQTELSAVLKEGPGSVRNTVMMCNRPWNLRSHEEMGYSLKTGKPAFDKVFGMDSWKWFAQHAEDQEIFNRAMTEISAGRQAGAVGAYDWRGISTIVDVGGGHGHLLGMVLKANPSMRGVVFDQPHVVKGAEAVLKGLGVGDRAKTVGGNFFESVPAEAAGPGAGGFDAVMMSHIIHDWDDGKSVAILKTCRKAVKPGGKVLLFENVVRPGNEPDLGKLIDLEMLVAVGGKERSEEEFAELFRASGWKLTRVVPTPAGLSVVEGVAV
jgi:SAM-dependent methyltransferase